MGKMPLSKVISIIMFFIMSVWLLGQILVQVQEFMFFFGTRVSEVVGADLAGVITVSGGMPGIVNITYEPATVLTAKCTCEEYGGGAMGKEKRCSGGCSNRGKSCVYDSDCEPETKEAIGPEISFYDITIKNHLLCTKMERKGATTTDCFSLPFKTISDEEVTTNSRNVVVKIGKEFNKDENSANAYVEGE